MKKSLLIIMSVAILGGLGIYINKGSSNPAPTVAPASNTAIDTGQTVATTNSSSSIAGTAYKDGTYDGSSAQTPYGTVQIAVVISGGKITDVRFLKMPYDQGHSQEVTAGAEPLLKQTTLDKQSANIDFVSGATSTSYGFEQSLQAALDKAAA